MNCGDISERWGEREKQKEDEAADSEHMSLANECDSKCKPAV